MIKKISKWSLKCVFLYIISDYFFDWSQLLLKLLFYALSLQTPLWATKPILRTSNLSSRYATILYTMHHASSPEVTKPLLKLRNLSSHHTTSPYITQIKSRDFWPTLSQTSFKSCKQNLRTTSPKVTQPLLNKVFTFVCQSCLLFFSPFSKQNSDLLPKFSPRFWI